MRTFNDLIFKQHPIVPDGVQAIMKLKNGYEISVVGGGRGLYGDGKKTFEIAVFDRQGEMIALGDGDQVLGYQTRDEVTDVIQKYDSKTVLKIKL
jgi:hypothetical protein